MMTWHEIKVEARDVLFFRGARPMTGSHVGKGADWPLPSVWHQALLSAFHACWPDPQPWERVAPLDRHPEAGTGRFGSLATCGLFPRQGDRTWVPAPADLGPDGTSIAELVRATGSNLPKPLTHVPAGFWPPSKDPAAKWIALDSMAGYLGGSEAPLVCRDGLFESESRPGIEIDPGSRGVKEGQFYVAEYLRLRDDADVRFVGFARCVEANGDAHDVVAEWLEGRRAPLVLGGQGGIAYAAARRVKETTPFQDVAAGHGKQVKWVLLTPTTAASASRRAT